MIISFSGHRLDKIGKLSLDNEKYKFLYSETERMLKELKPEKVISGMAVGYDQIAAVIALRLGIPVLAAIPFIGQENVWPEKGKILYHKILDKCMEKHIICEGGYSAHKLQIRNEWMVDNSDMVLALWNSSLGGTANCIFYAQKQDKQIFRINHDNQTSGYLI